MVLRDNYRMQQSPRVSSEVRTLHLSLLGGAGDPVQVTASAPGLHLPGMLEMQST